jgi:hypothetical protein
VGQKERTLPQPIRPKERVLYRLDLTDPKAIQGKLTQGKPVERNGRSVLAAVPTADGASRSLVLDLGPEGPLVAKPSTVLRFRYFTGAGERVRLVLRDRVEGQDDFVMLIQPGSGFWTTVTLPFAELPGSRKERDLTTGQDVVLLAVPKLGTRFGRIEWTTRDAEIEFVIDRLEVVEIEP